MGKDRDRHGRSGKGGQVMSLDLHITWILVGGITGLLAGLILKTGGYGLRTDLLLGLAGSLIGISIFEALADNRGAQRLTAGIVALVGAVSMIAGQRWWCPPA